MCLPAIPAVALMWATIGTSVAGTAATLIGQKQQADAQAEHQAQLTESATKVAYANMSQLRIGQAQSAEASARELEKARLASQKASSTAQVAAGEAGVSGNSVGSLLQEYGMQFSQFKEASTRQAQLGASSSEAQVEAARLGGDNQNLNINAPITGPNYLAEGLKLSSSALGAYQVYNPSAFKKAGT